MDPISTKKVSAGVLLIFLSYLLLIQIGNAKLLRGVASMSLMRMLPKPYTYPTIRA
jgi:hypothetical protein